MGGCSPIPSLSFMNQTASNAKIYYIFNPSKSIVIRFQANNVLPNWNLHPEPNCAGIPTRVIIGMYSFKKLLIRFLLLRSYSYVRKHLCHDIKKHKADSNCPFSKSMLLEVIKPSIFICLLYSYKKIRHVSTCRIFAGRGGHFRCRLRLNKYCLHLF